VELPLLLLLLEVMEDLHLLLLEDMEE